MTPIERWADIIKLFRAHGWEAIEEGVDNTGQQYVLLRRLQTITRLDERFAALMDARYQQGFTDGFERFAALMDARYQQGFTDGFERGAYEEQQQEDVEPGDRDVLHALTRQNC